MKHLQINDEFYTLKGLAICQHRVLSIALQPDGEIVYNWVYRHSDVMLSYVDAVKAINEHCRALMNKLNNDLKGGE